MKKNFVSLLVLAAIVSMVNPSAYAKPSTASGKAPKHSSPIKVDNSSEEETSTASPSETSVAEAEKASADEEEARKNAEHEAYSLRQIAQNQSLEHYDLARYYWSRWNMKMAELEYQAAIMYFPDMKVAHRDYCLLSFSTGHPMRGLAELMMVVGLGEPIPFSQDEQTAFKTRAAKLHNEQGIAYGRKSRWDRAIAEFKWALAYTPDNAAVERSLAFSYANKGDFELAERSYTRSFSEDPADGYAHADFAFLLADNGGGDRALKQLSEAVKLEPKDPALHVDMGWMAESKGDLSTAQSEFQQAVKLSPKHAGLWTHLGRVFEREGKAKEAKFAYMEAVALDPGQDEAKQHLDTLKMPKSENPPSPTSVDNSRKQS